ncbi:MAG: enoyl-CoA hydratase/isomerase family protein [Bacteroidetes bacterium]|nr:enoyl-CoA hydratase/isomerase family protein [Bacteroidota bacterium]
MEKIKIEFKNDNSVARIILDDGKGNVLDHVMMEELKQILNSFKSSSQIKLITMEGNGKHFSFGASIEEHKREFAATMIREFHQLFYIIRDLTIPMAAKISGSCLGGGLELALMCNFMFADKTARLGQPEISLGVFPPPASILLPEKIGLAKAEDLLITGRIITAEEAKSIGLVNELFDTRDTMDSGVEKWVESYILPKSASSLHFAVKAVRIKFNHVISNFLPQLESIYANQLMQTHDANEGINSFLEKRKPVWSNN